MWISQQQEGRRALLSVHCGVEFLCRSHLFLLPAAAGAWEHCKPLSVANQWDTPFRHHSTETPSYFFPLFCLFCIFRAYRYSYFLSCCTNKTLPLSYLTINLLPFPPSFTRTQVSSKLFNQDTLLYLYIQIFWQSFTLCHLLFFSHEEDKKKGVESNKKQGQSKVRDVGEGMNRVAEEMSLWLWKTDNEERGKYP